MFCSSCGTENPNEAKYCYKCGTRLLRQQNDNVTDSFKTSLSAEPVKAEKNIVTARKSIGLMVILLGLFIALAGGFSADYLSNAAKPLEVRSGYILDGEFRQYDSSTIGGNTEAVSTYNNLKYVFIIFGCICIVSGIVVYGRGSQFAEANSEIKIGVVIDLDILFAALEFADGSRERLRYNSNDVLLVIGDTGRFKIKEKQIIGFEKINYGR